MKKFFPIFIFFPCYFLGGQHPGLDWQQDTAGISISGCNAMAARDSAKLIQTYEELIQMLKSEKACFSKKEFGDPKFIDFEKGKAVLFVPYNGIDCHSTFDFSFKKDSAGNAIYRIQAKDGGCRAGGKYFVRTTLVPLPDEGKNFYLLHETLDTEGTLFGKEEYVVH